MGSPAEKKRRFPRFFLTLDPLVGGWTGNHCNPWYVFDHGLLDPIGSVRTRTCMFSIWMRCLVFRVEDRYIFWYMKLIMFGRFWKKIGI